MSRHQILIILSHGKEKHIQPPFNGIANSNARYSKSALLRSEL